MSNENSGRAVLKQKAIHEGEELVEIFLYLAFFFCALATYSMLLLKEFHVSYFSYGLSLINALVIAKVILIGEYFHLGDSRKTRPLILSAINKAFLFALLVFGFHAVEEGIKRLLHTGTREIRVDELLGRSLVVFCSFIPLFAFRELRRVMGEETVHNLFFRPGAIRKSDISGESAHPAQG